METNKISLNLFYSHYLIIKTSSKTKVIVLKKKIKHATKRVRMKRKIRYLNTLIHQDIPTNTIYFLFIINQFNDFCLEDYVRIKKKKTVINKIKSNAAEQKLS